MLNRPLHPRCLTSGTRQRPLAPQRCCWRSGSSTGCVLMVRGSAPTWSTPRAAPGTYEPRHVNLEGREIRFHFPQSFCWRGCANGKGQRFRPPKKPRKRSSSKKTPKKMFRNWPIPTWDATIFLILDGLSVASNYVNIPVWAPNSMPASATNQK